jgi:radical SAM superfamily enzyme YgiQ (UPF0313 family)
MVKFCIVSPPTVTEFDREMAESQVILRLAEHAPVGILTLAAVLAQAGQPPDIMDLNQLYYEYLREVPAPAADFCSYSVDRLLAREFDAVGFGTICSSYPLTLRIAEGVKRARPQARVVLGGPQASVVDTATLQRFPAVDYIVRHEAEHSLPQLLDVLEADRDPALVPGLTFRRGTEIGRTPNAAAIADLDSLPVPAYDRYPYLREASYIPLELGRGCPYGCTFCSTNDFFRRKFRLKTPALVVEQMTQLKAEYGIGVFDLIHDMFTVDRNKVIEFCEAILESGHEFFWNCSARTDRVDDELLTLMRKAGCRGIFFGIETGSQTLQKTIKKRLVLSDAMARIRAASGEGMQVAASLITGFPDETEADFADTVGFFADALRYENAQPQLHILAPLADTPIHREYRDVLTFDDIISDMSHQGWRQADEDRALIAAHPEIFPNFYAVPTPLDRTLVKEVRAFLLSSAEAMRWLLVALHQEAGGLLNVFLEFQEWRSGQGNPADRGSDGVPYFQTLEFQQDFVRFVEESVVHRTPVGHVLSALATYTSAFWEVDVEEPHADMPRLENGILRRNAFRPSSVPVLADKVRIVDVDVDFTSLMDCLVGGRPLSLTDQVPRRLASRKLPGHSAQVIQLSSLSASLLELCDGQRTVHDIERRIEALSLGPSGIPADKLCLVGLELLRNDGLIEDRKAPPPEGGVSPQRRG